MGAMLIGVLGGAWYPVLCPICGCRANAAIIFAKICAAAEVGHT